MFNLGDIYQKATHHEQLTDFKIVYFNLSQTKDSQLRKLHR